MIINILTNVIYMRTPLSPRLNLTIPSSAIRKCGIGPLENVNVWDGDGSRVVVVGRGFVLTVH